MLDTKLLGNKIKELRMRRGLTQGVFAKALHVSFQAVSNWERGIAPPDVENLIAIANYFGVLVDDLIRPTSNDLFLGIDGGGTKTEFVLVSSEGYVLRRFCKTGCNPNDIGFAKASALISDGIEEILREYPSVKAVFCGIAGITVGDYAKRLTSELKKRYSQITFSVRSDAFNLFALDDRAQMAVISGTGSVVFVKNGADFKRIGGWGYLLDRAGSAYDIGREALRAALCEEDLKLPPSLLHRLLCQRMNTPTVWEHISTVYSEGKAYVASLASTVFEAYQAGDPKAEAIIDETARALADGLNAGVRLYGAAPIAIASGGLFEHHREILLPRIAKYSNVELIVVDLPPIFGACNAARALTGDATSDEFYHSFKKTYGGNLQ